MKKTLLIVSIAAGLVACNTQPASDDMTKGVSYEDTVGFASFQDWKAQNERKDPSQYYLTGGEYAAGQAAPKPVTRSRSVTHPVAQTSPAPVAQAQKKGWSKAAKGTVIGTTAGAAAGAIINKKNRVLGGVIGGVLGGVGGYAIGRGMDRKDGRVN